MIWKILSWDYPGSKRQNISCSLSFVGLRFEMSDKCEFIKAPWLEAKELQKSL